MNCFLCNATTPSESAVAFLTASQRVSDAGEPVWTAEEGLELVGYEAMFCETSSRSCGESPSITSILQRELALLQPVLKSGASY